MLTWHGAMYDLTNNWRAAQLSPPETVEDIRVAPSTAERCQVIIQQFLGQMQHAGNPGLQVREKASFWTGLVRYVGSIGSVHWRTTPYLQGIWWLDTGTNYLTSENTSPPDGTDNMLMVGLANILTSNNVALPS